METLRLQSATMFLTRPQSFLAGILSNVRKGSNFNFECELNDIDIEDQPGPITEIENLHRENQSLMQRLEIADKNAKLALRAQLIAEERLRRQNELLQESRNATETAHKAQSQTLARLTELQKWTECVDDGEVVEIMRKLFQRLEDWTKRHFNQVVHAARSTRNTLPSSQNSAVTIQIIQAAVSEQLFYEIFSYFMIGFADREYDGIFYRIDAEVSRSC